MKYLFIINDAPYGSEKPYNALRLAMTLQKEHQVEVKLFFMGDAVVAALKNQKTPDGYYNMERMIKGVLVKQGEIYLCGTCLDARGIQEDMLITGTKRSTMIELASLTYDANQTLTF
jgi:uncharacterized protein involved in oxidation of intracellular sulfur